MTMVNTKPVRPMDMFAMVLTMTYSDMRQTPATMALTSMML